MDQRLRVAMVMVMGNNNGKLLIFNSLSGVLQLLLTAFLLFLCIPIFISYLGEEQYGIFSLVSVIGNLAVFANLSLDATLIKFLSEQGKTQESNQDIVIGIFLMSVILLPVSICLYIFKEYILLHILNIPYEYLFQSQRLFTYLVISNFVLILGKVFTAMLDSMHKIYLTNLITFIYSVIYWGGIIIAIVLGYGLVEIGFVIMSASLIWFSLAIFFSLKGWGRIELRGLSTSYKYVIRKQLSYTSKIYAGSLLAFFQEPLTKILIANFVGVLYVGIYEIALKVKSQIFSIFLKVLYPLFPLIAKLSDSEQIRGMVLKSTEVLFYLTLPVGLIIYFYTNSIVSLWIGGTADDLISQSIVVLVIFSVLFSVTVVPIYLYIRAKNHPEKEIVVQGIFTIVNLLIIFVTYRRIGFYAVLLSNAMATLASFAYCWWLYKKYLITFPFHEIKSKIKYLLVLILISLISVGIYHICANTTWTSILLKTIGIVLLIAGVYYKLKIISKEDLKYFTS